MGKLHKLRRAVRKNPELFSVTVYQPKKVNRGAHIWKDKGGSIRIRPTHILSNSYSKFIASVLQQLRSGSS